MKTILSAAMSALIALSLAACSTPGATTPSPESSSAATSSEAATADVAGPSTTAASVPGFDTPAPFGQTVTFPSGVEVTVKPVSFAPPGDDVGVVGDGNQATFSLTINNKSGTRIDASTSSWPKVSYGAGESATLISNADITTMLDGDKKTDKFSRFIPATGAAKVRVEVPDPSGATSAIFEGPVGK